MLSFWQKSRLWLFLFNPAYILGRVRWYENESLIVLILSWILAALLGLYISQIADDFYSRGAYNKDMQYAGTD